VPPGRLHASTGFPYQSLQRHLLPRRRPDPSCLGAFSATGLAAISARRLPLSSLSTSRFPALQYGPLHVSNIPVTGRRMWVCTLPLIDARPIRAPWPPSTSTRISYRSAPCVATGPLWVRFRRSFCDSRRFLDRLPPSHDWRTLMRALLRCLLSLTPL
jgi:hypothetical protein